MKKRYLFPVAFIVLAVLSTIIPALFPIIYLISMPSMVFVNTVFEWLGGPVDTTYAIVIGTLIQFFLLGYSWDLIAERFNRKESKIKI